MKSSTPQNDLPPERKMHPAETGYPAIFAYGFRPFFLLASIHAAIAIPLWIALLHGLKLPSTLLPAHVWHAHEMLYGFVTAAVTGFLLTAVPSWTSQRGYAGAPLVGLVLLWFSGRLVMTIPLGLPALWTALIDLAFIPALALTILPALIRSANRRNLVFVGLLALLFLSNLHFHLNAAITVGPLKLGLNTMLFMLAILGGRMIPAFTSAGLRQCGVDIRIKRYQFSDKMALLAVGCVLVTDLLFPDSMFAAVIAALSAVLLGLQLSHWQGYRTFRVPILWVLHVAYAWLPICLAIKAAGVIFVTIPSTSWMHALTVGAFSTMIIGIMSRATLGHTGRELVAPVGVVASYLLITGAALVRVFGPLLMPSATSLWAVLAALFWCLAFLTFLLFYAPILCSPRIDGRPG